MSNIPVHSIERTASHPAWTPVSVDGTAPTDGGTATAVGDPQPFGVGTAPFITGGTPNIHTFKGDAGQMIVISWLQYGRHHRGPHGRRRFSGPDAVG